MASVCRHIRWSGIVCRMANRFGLARARKHGVAQSVVLIEVRICGEKQHGFTGVSSCMVPCVVQAFPKGVAPQQHSAPNKK
eukprot:2311684-Amphidinium_carterae.1